MSKFSTVFNGEAAVDRYTTVEILMGPFAAALLAQSDLFRAIQSNSSQKPLRILDNACGTGIVSNCIYKSLGKADMDKIQITCGDISTSMVEYVDKRIAREQWVNAETKVIDAQKTGLDASTFDFILMNFGAQLIPDGEAFIRESYRILKGHGIFAFTTWIHVGWYKDMASALATGLPDVLIPDETTVMGLFSKPFEWNSPDYVRMRLEANGFTNVHFERQSGQASGCKVKQYLDLTSPILDITLKSCWSAEVYEKNKSQLRAIWDKYFCEKYGDGEVVQDGFEAYIFTAEKAE